MENSNVMKFITLMKTELIENLRQQNQKRETYTPPSTTKTTPIKITGVIIYKGMGGQRLVP